MKVTRNRFPRNRYRWRNGFTEVYVAISPRYALGIGDTAEAAKRDLHRSYRETKGKLR